MSTEKEVLLTDVLSEEEIQAVHFAQDLYGAEVEQATIGIADMLRLERGAKARLLGGVAIQTEKLNFEQRQGVSLVLQELLRQLGNFGIESQSETLPNATFPPVRPLGKAQKTWLSRLLPRENSAAVKDLSHDQILKFVVSISQAYKDLSIRRLGEKAKQQRAEQLIAFMRGYTYQELAAKYGTSSNSISNGLLKMTESITKRMDQEEIKAFIPSAEATELGGRGKMVHGEEGGVADESRLPGLSRIQKNWYKKIFEDQQSIDTIEAFSLSQQRYFAERLGRYIRSYSIRRHGPAKTSRRVQQVTLLIEGKALDEIVEVTDLDEVSVKQELHNIAGSIQRRTPQRVLKKIVEEVQHYTPEAENGS